MASPSRFERLANILLWFFLIAGVLFLALCIPASFFPEGNPRNARAKADLANSFNAIRAFKTEYNRFPMQAAGKEDLLVDHTNQRGMYNILRAVEQDHRTPADLRENSRGIIFFETLSKRDIKADGTVVDPWGNPYQFVLDTDGDGKVTIPVAWKRSDSGQVINAPLIGYSSGKTDSPKDDVVTW